jgi:solute carrier family 44 protein 1 (choline transporter-like protein)
MNGMSAYLSQDDFTVAARWINVVAFIWFTNFILGCQHFVIAGTISKWYFTRDKTKISQPILTSFKNLIYFHLGSVCLGSWIITIIKIIRIILRMLRSSGRRNLIMKIIAMIASWIMNKLDTILQYFIRNAYICVAKDGLPFVQAGRKSFDLIVHNLIDVVALNYLGDTILVLGRLFIILISGFIGYEIMVNNL